MYKNGNMFARFPRLKECSLNRARLLGDRKYEMLNTMDNIGTGLENFLMRRLSLRIE